MTSPEQIAARRTFTTPQGRTFALIGSHTSTVRVGEQPYRKPGCAGCARAAIEEAGHGG